MLLQLWAWVTVVALPLVALVQTNTSCYMGLPFPEHETALRTEILTDYDRQTRPSAQTNVSIDLVVFSLNKLNIEEQDMSITGVVYLFWQDRRLQWNPLDYCNISSLMVEWESVWQPTLIVENSVDASKPLGMEGKPPLRIYYDGRVKSMVPVIMKVNCEMRIISFPFDTQQCSLKLFPWGYDVSELYLNYTDDPIRMDYYSDNGEWDWLTSRKFPVNVSDSLENFTRFCFQFTFRRKWIFLFLTMIVPAVLNSILMSAVFALPFESGEKIGYSLTVLLTYIVLLTLVTDSLPPISTDTSVLQIYLTGVMCTGTIATLLTVWTVTMYNQDPAKPRPACVIYLCNRIIRPLVCSSSRSMKRSKTSENSKNKNASDSSTGVRCYGNQKQSSRIGTETRKSSSATHGHCHRRSSYPTTLFQNPSSYRMNSNGRPFQQSATLWENHCVDSAKASDGTRLDNRKVFTDLPRSFYLGRDHVCPEYSTAHNTGINHKHDLLLDYDDSFLRKCGGDKAGFSSTENPGPPREKPCSQGNEDPSKTFDEDDISWVQVANLMDALFLRIISAIIFAGTLALIIYFRVAYDSYP